MTDLSSRPNIGKDTESKLILVEINSNAQLQAAGIEQAFLRLQTLDPGAQPTKRNKPKEPAHMQESVFLENAFFPHRIGFIVLQRYFPAEITSIILDLSYSLWISAETLSFLP